MKVFLIVFGLAILFVVGSAAAMRYFDNTSSMKKNSANKSNRN